MNSKRGQVSFKANGEELHLKVTTNAMVKYQDISGQTYVNSILHLQENSTDMKVILNIFWSIIVEDKTIEECGDIVDDLGFKQTIELIGDATNLAFPGDEGDLESGNVQGVKPPKQPPTS